MSIVACGVQTRTAAELGVAAYSALSASGGAAYPIEGFGRAGYFQANNHLILIGQNPNLLHPRTVIVNDSFDVSALWLDISTSQIWEPTRSYKLVGGLAGRCRSLIANLIRTETPKGFGVLLSGELLPAPFQATTSEVTAVAEACFCDNPAGSLAAGRNLVGVGFGLTPSGDDYMGAALFARMQLSSGIGADTSAWITAAEILAQNVSTRSHPISAAFFKDITNGYSFAPLHALASALIDDAPAITSLAAARRLIGIGHSSGWDMLAGLIGAWTGTLNQFSEVHDEC